jgi:hypothetical protein
MKQKIMVGFFVLLFALTFQSCALQELHYLIHLEAAFESGITSRVCNVDPSMPLGGTWEIQKGTHNFSGQINQPGTDTSLTGQSRPTLPSQLNILIQKKKKTTTSPDTISSAPKPQAITFSLQVDPSTGTINSQDIVVKKAMVIDPIKNEYLEIYVHFPEGYIPAASTFDIKISKVL